MPFTVQQWISTGPVARILTARRTGSNWSMSWPSIGPTQSKPSSSKISALRGHLGEFGRIVPQGAANTAGLIAIVDDPDSGFPADAIATLKVLVAALAHLEEEIGKLDAEIARRAKTNEVARRLMTIPGIGPLIATAIAVMAPPPKTFRKACDFAAWLGLTPRQHSTGGKQRLGATTRMGERSLRRLLIIGANSVIIKRRSMPPPGRAPGLAAC